MQTIKRAVRVKSIDSSEENIQKAKDKCFIARNLLNDGYSNSNNEDIFKGVEVYLESIEIYSRLIEPYLAIAEICKQFNMKQDSISLLNKVLELESNNKNALKMLDQINKKINNFDNIKKVKKVEAFLPSIKNNFDIREVASFNFEKQFRNKG